MKVQARHYVGYALKLSLIMCFGACMLRGTTQMFMHALHRAGMLGVSGGRKIKGEIWQTGQGC